MDKINVFELEPGMVLASDLKDRNGRFLLGKGVKLTSRHLRIMKMWGVVETDVEGICEKKLAAKRTARIAPEILEAADKLTRKRFIHTDLEHEAVRQLFHICLLRKAREITGGAHPASTQEQMFDASPDSDRKPLMKKTRTRADYRKLIRNKMGLKLPSLPIIFREINEAINDPRSSAAHVANIIGKDAGLSAQLLKIVNSAFYNFPSRIDTISRAVAIIGTRELSALALGTTALTVFKDVPSNLIDMRSFWEHSVACGIIAGTISSYMPNTTTERFFVAGLLHDIGRLIMFKYAPLDAKEALLRARRTNSLLHKTEEEVMGTDHTLIGSILLKEWKLPVTLENSVRRHHAFTKRQIPLEPAVVHLSDLIANALELGTSGERFVPPLDAKAWEEIGLSPGILNATVTQVDSRVAETVHIFFPDEEQPDE